ncbi:transporter [Ruminococcaceae bacterium OttesenSCG-928-D13]|nr:transporter [Ruminococcaceae bacterium OttesenSCG-928-D13]
MTDWLSKGAYFAEVLISFVLLAAVVILLIATVLKSGIFWPDVHHLDFNEFLSNVFNLIIGVEFTKMLCKHTPDTVVEVLLFAIARQVVITHGNIWESILGVVAIAGLFAIRKFLIPQLPKHWHQNNETDCSQSELDNMAA